MVRQPIKNKNEKHILHNFLYTIRLLPLHVRKRGPPLVHPPPGMPDYDDLCDELTYDELTDGLSTCSGSVNDLLDQLGVEDSRQNGCQVTEYIQYTCTYSFFDVTEFPRHAW